MIKFISSTDLFVYSWHFVCDLSLSLKIINTIISIYLDNKIPPVYPNNVPENLIMISQIQICCVFILSTVSGNMTCRYNVLYNRIDMQKCNENYMSIVCYCHDNRTLLYMPVRNWNKWDKYEIIILTYLIRYRRVSAVFFITIDHAVFLLLSFETSVHTSFLPPLCHICTWSKHDF